MSTTFSTPIAAGGMAWRSRGRGPAAFLKGLLAAYLARRIERTAMMQLHSMSDRELHDIGLSRSQIGRAVRGEPAVRPLRGYY